jgi:hypothetical protein
MRRDDAAGLLIRRAGFESLAAHPTLTGDFATGIVTLREPGRDPVSRDDLAQLISGFPW